MNIKKLNQTIRELHHASQLVAISGRDLVTPQENNRHAAMEYSHSRRMLAGSVINADKNIRVALDISHIDLHILSQRLDSLAKFDLKGRTKEDGFNYLKNELRSFGADTTLMDSITSWNIPDHPSGRNNAFGTSDHASLELHVKLRALAKDILQLMARVFGNFSEILVWPHNFNTQMQIFLDPDSEGNMQSELSLGLGIEDDLSDQPYFYVKHHSKRDIEYPGRLPALDIGQWSTGKNKIAYLKLSDLDTSIDPERQEDKISAFFSQAIEKSMDLLT